MLAERPAAQATASECAAPREHAPAERVPSVLDAVEFAGLVAVCAVLTVVRHRRARRRLAEWADREGVRIVAREARYVRSGPFTGRHRRGQFVFKVQVVDEAGAIRSGWVRFGHPAWGLLADDTAVVWDAAAG